MEPEPRPVASPAPGWPPYVIPMAVYLLLTQAEGWLPRSNGVTHPLWYPLAYVAKVAMVAVAAWWGRPAWRDFRPWPGMGVFAMSAALGLVVTAVWVGLNRLPIPMLPLQSAREGFNPRTLPPLGGIGFLAVRFLGLVALVPLIEELFWRSFLMRWIINPEFETVAVGKVTPIAAAATSILFALAHPEWLAALLTGLAWAALLGKTKSLSACLVSHVAANLALGLYVFWSGEWIFL